MFDRIPPGVAYELGKAIASLENFISQQPQSDERIQAGHSLRTLVQVLEKLSIPNEEISLGDLEMDED